MAPPRRLVWNLMIPSVLCVMLALMVVTRGKVFDTLADLFNTGPLILGSIGGWSCLRTSQPPDRAFNSAVVFLCISDKRKLTPKRTAPSFWIVRSLLIFNAGSCFLSWLVCVAGSLTHFGGDVPAVYAAVTTHWAAYFLFVDALVLYVAILLFFSVACGWQAVAHCVLLTCIVGPGAAVSLVLAQREGQLQNRFIKSFQNKAK